MHIPGIYQALLVREREHHERWGERKVDVDPDEPSKGFFLRDRHLLDALEAGEPVTLSTSQIGGRGVPSLPPEWRGSHRWFSVSADDRVAPTESPVVDPIAPPSGND